MFSDVFLGFPMVSVKNPTFSVDFSPENFKLFFLICEGFRTCDLFLQQDYCVVFDIFFENKQKR